MINFRTNWVENALNSITGFQLSTLSPSLLRLQYKIFNSFGKSLYQFISTADLDDKNFILDNTKEFSSPSSAFLKQNERIMFLRFSRRVLSRLNFPNCRAHKKQFPSTVPSFENTTSLIFKSPSVVCNLFYCCAYSFHRVQGGGGKFLSACRFPNSFAALFIPRSCIAFISYYGKPEIRFCENEEIYHLLLQH